MFQRMDDFPLEAVNDDHNTTRALMQTYCPYTRVGGA